MVDPIGIIFGLSGEHFTTVIVAVILFILLFIDFGIILKNFSAFSPWIAWMIAFFLCIVAGVSGIIAIIVLFFVGILGYVGTALLLIALKVGATIIELSLSKKARSDKKLKEKMEEEAGLKIIREIGKSGSKIGKKSK